jgi:quercetin dioxygenase-like cupin family protein
VLIARSSNPQFPTALVTKTFTGEVWGCPLSSGDDVRVATVSFTPGSRTFWHRHDRGQILQVLTGSGFVCTRSEGPTPLRAGDIVWTPPGEEHWHGAAPESHLVHVAISLGNTLWGIEVTSDEYAGR